MSISSVISVQAQQSASEILLLCEEKNLKVIIEVIPDKTMTFPILRNYSELEKPMIYKFHFPATSNAHEEAGKYNHSCMK